MVNNPGYNTAGMGGASRRLPGRSNPNNIVAALWGDLDPSAVGARINVLNTPQLFVLD